jgi:hypothetical protein
MTKKQRGLYNKYIITKSSGEPLDPNFYAIVLRIDGGRHVMACRNGALAFAQSVKAENPLLARDIWAKVRKLEVAEERVKI